VNWSAEATIRGALGNLRDVGALEKRSGDQASNAVVTALTPTGEEMLAVLGTLEHWLKQCPKGPIPIDDEHVKVAVKALAEGWNSTLMRALASAPLTLTELSGLIPDVSYPALERRIAWMRATGQISALPKEGRGTPYVPTAWLGRAISPIAVAARCERLHMDDAPPITDVEIETAFLLTLPLLELPTRVQGSCLLASRTDPVATEGPDLRLAGIAIEVLKGQVVSSTVAIDDEPTTWAIGTSDNWLDAFIDRRLENLRIGGTNPKLALDLIQGIHFSTVHRSMNM
jgi:DNA-binding HxlR family transcriptional regulator